MWLKWRANDLHMVPAVAAATPLSLTSLKSRLVNLSGARLTHFPAKEAVKWVSFYLSVIYRWKVVVFRKWGISILSDTEPCASVWTCAWICMFLCSVCIISMLKILCILFADLLLSRCCWLKYFWCAVQHSAFGDIYWAEPSIQRWSSLQTVLE